jgi:putative nucleotidyltransferase with HDIG domain
LPTLAVSLLTELGAPPRLAAHLRAVHDVAAQLVDWLGDRCPGLDAPTLLLAAALHDIGKVRHPEELSGPGSSHEDGGYELLRAREVDERVAELVRDHGSWQRPDASLELLLVSLADAVWKDKRREDLEQLVVHRIAAATGQEPWQIFADLDELLTAIGSRAVQRLAYQNAYGTR